MKQIVLILFIVFSFLFSLDVHKVSAHSSITKTLPHSDELLTTPPKKVEVWFKDPVEIYSSSVKIVDENNNYIQNVNTTLDSSNSSHMITQLPEQIPSGNYKVIVDVLSYDGHRLNESFNFKVNLPDNVQMWQQFEFATSNPSDGEVIEESPNQIDLYFTNEFAIDSVGIFDDNHQPIMTEQPVKDENDPNHTIVKLKQKLKKGTYKVFWSSVYIDVSGKGSQKVGIYYFAVGEVTSFFPSTQPKREYSFDDFELSDLSSFLSNMGLLFLVGGVAFFLYIAKENGRINRWRITRLVLYVISIVGLTSFIFAHWFGLNKESSISIYDYVTLREVQITIVQNVLLIISFFLKRRLSLVILILTLALESTMGHSIVPRYGGTIGILIDFVHLMAVSIWLGGLLALIVLTPKEKGEHWLLETRSKFSRWAIISMLLVILSGLLMSIQYVPSFSYDSLIASDWGLTLVIKVIIVIEIMILAYIQRQSLRNLIKLKKFLTIGKIEIVLGIIVLVLATFLVEFSPTDAEQGIYPKQVEREGIVASLNITPFKPGVNDLIFQFSYEENIRHVDVNFFMPLDDYRMNRAFSLGDGKYKLTGNFFHSSGQMFIEAHVTTIKGEVISFPFRIQVPGNLEH